MHIFIDESGNCVKPQDGSRNLACVGAIVVPGSTLASLEGSFKALKGKWGVTGLEVKGSALDEQQVAAVLNLLLRCECLFFVTTTEMSVNDKVFMESFKQTETENLTVGLTENANPELVAQVKKSQAAFRAMAPQLHLQLFLLTDLLKKVLDVATLHFAMTRPEEIGAFHWVVDEKNPHRAPYEEAWLLLARGFLQDRNLRSPGVMATEGDYSHFARFFAKDQSWPSHLPPPTRHKNSGGGMLIDFRSIYGESFNYVDSRSSIGIQLADIVTNAFRRAMLGRIGPRGYCNLGKLMVRVEKDPFTVALFADPASSPKLEEYTEPLQMIRSRSRFAGR